MYTPLDTVRIYVETLQRFKDAPGHTDFIGSRMIYAPLRNTNAAGVQRYIETLKEVKVREQIPSSCQTNPNVHSIGKVSGILGWL